MNAYRTSGWSWSAFLLGPLWYILNGIVTKGAMLSLLAIATLGLSLPFLMIYCGARGQGDLYDHTLKRQSKLDPNNL